MTEAPAKSFRIRLAQLLADDYSLLNSNELKLLFVGTSVELAALDFLCFAQFPAQVLVSSGGAA
jgi:hypothetical protein